MIECCPKCGGEMVGDGYTAPYHCEFTTVPDGTECDADPIYCDFEEYDECLHV